MFLQEANWNNRRDKTETRKGEIEDQKKKKGEEKSTQQMWLGLVQIKRHRLSTGKAMNTMILWFFFLIHSLFHFQSRTRNNNLYFISCLSYAHRSMQSLPTVMPIYHRWQRIFPQKVTPIPVSFCSFRCKKKLIPQFQTTDKRQCKLALNNHLHQYHDISMCWPFS